MGNETAAFWFGVAVGMVLAVVVMGPLCRNSNTEWEQEAIKRGFAEWRMVDQKTGKTEWVWKGGPDA